MDRKPDKCYEQLKDKVCREMANLVPDYGAKTYLLAVSGGRDSMLLWYLFEDLGLKYAVAHVNYGLRGRASDEDEKLVTEYGKKTNVDVFVKSAKLDGESGIQEEARALRYTYFDEFKDRFDYVCLAHHADDQVETILQRFLRGTGLRGLRGMPAKRGQYIRPLLGIFKEEISTAVKEKKVGFREDASNAENKYMRNKIRNQLVPVLSELQDQFRERLLLTGELAGDGYQYLQRGLSGELEKISEWKGSVCWVSVRGLQKSQDTGLLLFHLLETHGFPIGMKSELEKLLSSASGKFLLHGKKRIIKYHRFLLIGEKDSSEGLFLLSEIEGALEIGSNRLSWKIEGGNRFSIDAARAEIDAAKLDWPLVLRRWRAGDYLYPIGLNKKQKLSKFFKDHKLSLIEKEEQWVLTSGNKVVWLVGRRLDERFKVGKHTEQMLVLTWS